MHVGMSAIFQNPGHTRPDRDIYKDDIALADLAEPLGFESIWAVEHHFTDYTMCPDPLQFLSFMAGRTKTAQLGTMVVVLPWRDLLRTAEQISMLDNISDGRLILGLGRGAGRVEFDGFRLDMAESRSRFVEAAQMVLTGLESGHVEFQGEHYQQPRVAIRPEPFKSFRGRTYAAAVSPESSRIMAELGIGLLVIPQKPWEHLAREFDGKEIFRAKQAPLRRSQRTAARTQTKIGAHPAKAPCKGMVWAAPRPAVARLFTALSNALGSNLAAWAGGVFVDQPRRCLFRVNPT